MKTRTILLIIGIIVVLGIGVYFFMSASHVPSIEYQLPSENSSNASPSSSGDRTLGTSDDDFTALDESLDAMG